MAMWRKTLIHAYFTKNGVRFFVGVCVDVLKMSGGNLNTVLALKKMFCKRFQMKDRGLVSDLLGLRIIMDSKHKGLLICQR